MALKKKCGYQRSLVRDCVLSPGVVSLAGFFCCSQVLNIICLSGAYREEEQKKCKVGANEAFQPGLRPHTQCPSSLDACSLMTPMVGLS